MVAQTLDSSNFGLVWDKFQVFQGHKRNSPYIQIGRKSTKKRRLKFEKHPNAFKQALYYQDLLDSGQADSQVELARLIGTPRSTISAYLRLLGIDEDVRAEALGVADDDPMVALLTESRLRRLPAVKSAQGQRRKLRKLLAQERRR